MSAAPLDAGPTDPAGAAVGVALRPSGASPRFDDAEPVTVDDGAMIATSFPDFMTLMTKLGAKFS